MFSSTYIVPFALFAILWFSPTLCQKASITSSCTKDEIKVVIPTYLVTEAWTHAPVHHQLVMFHSDASEHCRAQVQDQNHYVMAIKIKSNLLCGTKIKETNNEKIYTNEIVWLDSSTSLVKSLYNITCLYSDEENVYIIPKTLREIDFTTPYLSKVRASISLYRDKSFAPSAVFKDETPSISVGQFVYVSVNLSRHISLKPVTISSKNCHASFYPDAKDKRIVHNFIENGCVHARDSSVMIFHNRNETVSQWRFQMFKWVNVTVQRIYLFCEIDFCDSADCTNQNHTEDCFKSERTKRNTPQDGSKAQPALFLATGPIFPTDSEMLKKRPENSGESGKSVMNNIDKRNGNTAAIAIGVVSAVCVIIIIVASIIMIKRHRKKKMEKEEANSPKNGIEQGFAFVITSSNDQNLYGNENSEKTTKDKKVHRSTSQKLRTKIKRSASALSRKECQQRHCCCPPIKPTINRNFAKRLCSVAFCFASLWSSDIVNTAIGRFIAQEIKLITKY